MFKERDAEMVHLYTKTTSTLEEIGQAYGVTRERVRQIVVRSGVRVTRYHGVDPLTVLKAARSKGVSSFGALRDRCGIQMGDARRCLLELGVWPAVQRLWRMRGRPNAIPTAVLIERLQMLAVRLGRTPNLHDINRAKDIPVHTTYVNRFGSVKAAQSAAGLTPNGVGAPGRSEATRQRLRHKWDASCRNGHARTPENVYLWIDKNGRTIRQCRACKREARKVA